MRCKPTPAQLIPYLPNRKEIPQNPTILITHGYFSALTKSKVEVEYTFSFLLVWYMDFRILK